MKYTFRIDTYDGKGLRNFNVYNNTSLPFVGFSEINNLNEELDSCYIEVISDIEEIPIMSYIEFLIDNDLGTQRRFYVGNDSSERLEKDKERYIHKLDLVEVTKKLEKKIVETICFTQSQNKDEINYTLWDVLHRVWRIYEIGNDDDSVTIATIQDYSNYPNPNGLKIIHDIDGNLKTMLQSIEAPTLVLNNMTLREIFNEVFAYVDGIANFKSRYMLSCEFYNQLKQIVDYTNKHESFSTSSSVEDYATELQSFVENQINDKTGETYNLVYPNEVSFEKAKTRPSNYVLNDTNYGILLPYPIYILDDIITNITVEIRFGTTLKHQFSPDWSLKDYIVEESIYNSLPTSYSGGYLDKLTKNNTISYKYKDNFIELSNTYKPFLVDKSATLSAMSFAVAKGLAQNWDFYGFDYSNEATSGSYYFNIGYTNSNGSFVKVSSNKLNVPVDTDFWENFSVDVSDNLNNTWWKHFSFRTKYKTLTNTRLRTNKNDISDTKINTSSLMNQNNRIISLQNLSNNMKSKIERMGNFDYLITIRHTDTNVFDKGDYFIGEDNKPYILCKRELVYYNDFIIGKYEFTKNYSRLSEFIGVNSEVRQWQIPSGNETYERVIKLDNYCYIYYDDEYDMITQDTNVEVTENGIKKMLSFYNHSTHPANNVIYVSEDEILGDDYIDENPDLTDVQEYWNEMSSGSNSLMLQCISEGTKDSLKFDFGFNDNITAGTILTNDESGLKTLIQKVPYANPYEGKRLGFLRNCNLTVVNDKASFSTEDLPLTIFNEQYNTDNIYIKTPKKLILKDSAEILKFAYQINFINKSTDKIVIGNGFGKYNPLVWKGDLKLNINLIGDSAFNKNNLIKSQGSIFQKNIENNTDVMVASSGNEAQFSLMPQLWDKLQIRKNAYYPNEDMWILITNADNNDLIFAFKHSVNANIWFAITNNREDLVEKY